MRGYNVMRGFIHDPEATAETIDADGWLHTGDIAVMDEAGYIRITDRMKDMFIVGGFNAYPAEIEGMMLEHPALSQVAVVGVPDDRMGEVGMAYVVLRPGAELTDAELIAWCREQDGELQGAAPGRVRRRAAAEREWQGPQDRAARTGRRGLNSTVAPVLIFASPISDASRAGAVFGSMTAS